MSTVKPTSVEGLKDRLGDVLCALEERFAGGRRLASTLGGRLAALIDCAAAGRKGSVVVLVDEYNPESTVYTLGIPNREVSRCLSGELACFSQAK